jgi:hypothetical protein
MASLIKRFLISIGFIVCFTVNSWAFVAPPEIEPILSIYDDFYSFSSDVLVFLDETQTFDLNPSGTLPNPYYGTLAGYDIPTGSGQLDLFLIAGGFQGVNADLGFELGADGHDIPLDGSWSAETWRLYDYLLNGSGATVPGIFFDTNEAKKDLFVNGYVTISDGSRGTPIASWYFDNITNGDRDANSMILIPENIEVDVDNDGDTDKIIERNSAGSGGMEFLVYAPTLDLADWVGEGMDKYWINYYFTFADQDDGFEEAWFTGVKRTPPNVVPEPSSMLLLGIGVTVLAYMRRNRNR